MEYGETVITFTWELLIAAPAGAAAGLLSLLSRMLSGEARFRHIWRTVKGGLEDVLRVAGIDAAAGLLAALAVAFLGISHPTALVALFEWSPWLCWSLLGATAPLASWSASALFAGTRLRVYQSTAARDHGRLDLKKVQSFINALKQSPSRRLIEQVWVLSRQEENAFVEALQAQARELAASNDVHFDDFWADLECWAELHEAEIPEKLCKIRENRSRWPTRTDPSSDTASLIDGMVTSGLYAPLSASSRFDRQEFHRRRKQELEESAMDTVTRGITSNDYGSRGRSSA